MDSREVEKTLQIKGDSMKNFCKSLLVVALASVSLAAVAQTLQTPPGPQYGTTVNLEQARKVVAAAMVEARKNSWGGDGGGGG